MKSSPFWIALQFLSSLPIRLPGMPTGGAMGQSLLYYPGVGLLLGLLLCAGSELLQGVPLLLHAALLLAGWVLFTGGLHLDGLADSADAWLGGFGDRERTLLIMKDPRSGPIAVITLMLVLLLKFCALLALIESGQWWALITTPVLARTAMLGLFLSTPYVRPGGLGKALAEHLPRKTAKGVLAVAGLAAWLVVPLAVLIVAALVFAWLRSLMVRRLGGTTGDTAGALLELLEMATLVAWVVLRG